MLCVLAVLRLATLCFDLSNLGSGRPFPGVAIIEATPMRLWHDRDSRTLFLSTSLATVAVCMCMCSHPRRLVETSYCNRCSVIPPIRQNKNIILLIWFPSGGTATIRSYDPILIATPGL